MALVCNVVQAGSLEIKLGRVVASLILIAGLISAKQGLRHAIEYRLERRVQRGTSINTNNWTYDLGGGGFGNNELEFYTNSPQNAYVSNGLLHIVALTNGSGYTSARMKTQGKQSWAYGRMEARIQIPRGQGIWPAFWMLGTNFPSVPWPACGEIDIMENIGNTSDQGTDHGTIHGPVSGDGGLQL